MDKPTAFSFDSLASNSMKSSNPVSGCREVDVSKTLDCSSIDPTKNQGGIAIVQPTMVLNDQGGAQMGISYDVTSTLRAEDHQHPPAVAYGLDQQGGKGGANYSEEVCPPILSDSHGTPHAIAFAQNQREEVRDLDDTVPTCIGNGQGDIASHISEEMSQTLNCMHDPMAVMTAVDCRNGTENADVNGTLQAKEQGQNLNSNNVARTGNTVRRLTPLECERLQNFPDHWTDIGEWVDSQGKKHKDADTPRYKALGNSIALPFWDWLLGRISAQYDRPATLGSLFDGIGGFPLCWEKYNGKGSALWASEIEEFPIAVTKLRFPEDDDDNPQD